MFHSELCKRFSWYERWHTAPRSGVLHWSIFVLFLVVVANVLSNSFRDNDPIIL